MYRRTMLEGLPNNATDVMRLACDEATALRVADAIVETLDPAETAASVFAVDADAPSWTDSRWAVEVYFGARPDEAAIRALIAAYAGEQLAQNATFDRVAERDWVKAGLARLSPVRAGRFLIHGAHDRGRVRSHDIALEIAAALTFGTGHHGTTRGCLLMLDRILKQRRPQCILDVGTGTGILALAAAKALRQSVAACDIDPVSVAATSANARLNGASPYVRPVAASGVRHPSLRAGAPYDLIFANILAEPLRLLSSSITDLAAARGDLILSGLLGRDVPGVLSVYGGRGFLLAERIDLVGWATLRLKRGGAPLRPLRQPPICLRGRLAVWRRASTIASTTR